MTITDFKVFQTGIHFKLAFEMHLISAFPMSSTEGGSLRQNNYKTRIMRSSNQFNEQRASTLDICQGFSFWRNSRIMYKLDKNCQEHSEHFLMKQLHPSPYTSKENTQQRNTRQLMTTSCCVYKAFS